MCKEYGGNMIFTQRTNFYKQLPDGTSKMVAKNIPLRLSISTDDIIGVQEVFNERTGKPYKKICMLNLVNYAQYNNQLIVNYDFKKMRDFIELRNKDEHIVIRGFGR